MPGRIRRPVLDISAPQREDPLIMGVGGTWELGRGGCLGLRVRELGPAWGP